MEKPAVFNLGEIVYFKSAKRSSKTKVKVGFTGHAFGCYLGHVPQFARDPSPSQIFQGFGMMGFILFDDIAEFLGEEMAQQCIEKHQAKYYVSPEEAGVEEKAAEPSKILNLAGKPIDSEPEIIL